MDGWRGLNSIYFGVPPGEFAQEMITHDLRPFTPLPNDRVCNRRHFFQRYHSDSALFALSFHSSVFGGPMEVP